MRSLLLKQIEKLKKLIPKLHEDLQFDYQHEFDLLLEEAGSKVSWFHKKDYEL